jgi:2-polyprenyl-6-methoxyphenol hydroxylase-like FAD-dependent oxidoreductase
MGEIAPDAWLLAGEVLEQAQRVLAPYTLEVHETAWFSVYRVGHTVTDKFDDIADNKVGTRSPRVFIAGDGCHTHTAKAGQGMNVSMQDTFNLGWKLAAVLQGRSPAALLDTYSQERKKIAEDLIETDTRVVAGDGRSRPDRLPTPRSPRRHSPRSSASSSETASSPPDWRRTTLPDCSPATTPTSTRHPATHRNGGSSRPRSSASASQARPPRARAPRRRPVAALRLC